VPADRFVLNFAGNENDIKTATRFINLARTENFAYSLVRVSSENLTSLYSATVETAGDFIFNAGVGTGFTSNFDVNSLINQALVLNNTYVGKVVSNTEDSVTLDTAYTYGGGDGLDLAEFLPVGTLLFQRDGSGQPFVPVINLPVINEGTPSIKVHVRDTKTIPASPMNLVETAIRITAIEATD